MVTDLNVGWLIFSVLIVGIVFLIRELRKEANEISNLKQRINRPAKGSKLV